MNDVDGMENKVKVPFYYSPWPHQIQAWKNRLSGKYNFYFKLWGRQLGKDTDDIQYALKTSWDTAGIQSAYIGLDNVWITNNIFKKYIDGRKHWMDYPSNLIDVKETQKEVFMLNNPEDIAPSRIKFIGFLNDQQLIGSSYDQFFVSEASLYQQSAFQFIRPIWDRKLAMGIPLLVNFNGTPRGTRNVLYDLLRVYTGVDDPELFPGEHGNCYVDKCTIREVLVPDGHGGFKPMYSPAEIERLQSQYLREFGNLNFYYQENECDFTTVNAGLVYQGVEQLEKEGRFREFNLDSSRPVYIAFDIASKNKMTDSTSAIIFQYYNGTLFLYDMYETRGKSLVEAIAEISHRDYFHLIRWGILPWDSERSASSETPIEEARRMFPNINWHCLDKERVDRGITLVRRMLPNTIVNKKHCDWIMTCFHNYEYKRLEAAEDWAAQPKHNVYSHMMDCLRYCVMGINEMQYLQLNDLGADPMVAGEYEGFWEPERTERPSIWAKKPQRKKGDESYGY